MRRWRGSNEEGGPLRRRGTFEEGAHRGGGAAMRRRGTLATRPGIHFLA